MLSPHVKRYFKTAISIIGGIAVALLLIQYFPLLKAELFYLVRKPTEKRATVVIADPITIDNGENVEIKAVDKEFSLIVPKIGVNVKVIPEIDPFDSKEYQKALSQGIAHTKGTALPQERKNTVLFAHSTDNFYNANKYNAVFYLLNKLKIGDKVYVAYKSRLYKYTVTENSVVENTAMEYMEQGYKSRLTLVTCWPPGTTLKRLVIVAVESTESF